MGGFVESNEDLYRLRLKTVRSHIQAKWAASIGMHFGREFNSLMKHLYNHTELLMHPKIPQMVQAYFEDIYMVLEALYDKAGKRAQVLLVVSTSAYAGIESLLILL